MKTLKIKFYLGKFIGKQKHKFALNPVFSLHIITIGAKLFNYGLRVNITY